MALVAGCRGGKGERGQGAKARVIEPEPSSTPRPVVRPPVDRDEPGEEAPVLRSRVTMAQLVDSAGPLAFSRDGGLLAVSSGASRDIHVFRVADGSVAGRAPQDCCSISALAFSPDGRLLYVGGGGGGLGLLSAYDIERGELSREFKGYKAGIHQVHLSDDGRLMLTTSLYENRYVAWDTASGEQLWSKQGQDGDYNAALSPDGELAALQGSKKKIILVNARDGSLNREIDPGFRVDRLMFRGGALIALLRDDASLLVRIDVKSGSFRPVSPVGGDDYTNVFALSPDAKLAAINGQSGRSLRLVDTTGAASPREFIPAAGGYVPSLGGLAFSPDGKLLAVGAGRRVAHLYDTSTWETKTPYEGNLGRIDEVSFLNGQTAQTRDGGRFCEWDLSSLRMVGRRSLPVSCEPVAVNPAGTHAMCRSLDGASERFLQVVERASGKKVAELRLDDAVYEQQVGWPAGKYAYIKQRGKVLAVDPLRGSIVKEIAIEDSFSQRLLATERKVYVFGGLPTKTPGRVFAEEISVGDWAVRRLGPMAEPLWVERIGEVPDGSHFWFTTRQNATWFVRHDDLAPAMLVQGYASRVSFDAQGRRLALVHDPGRDGPGEVRVHEWPSGRELRRITSAHFRGASVSFTPDGRSLLVVRAEGILELFPADAPAGSR